MQIQTSHQKTGAANTHAHAVETRCPHGRIGACFQCMGGGGGGGGTAKRNTAGLMTWNQAWALWTSIKTANARQTDYLKGVTTHQAQVRQDTAVSLQQAMGRMLAGLIQAATPVSRGLNQMMSVAGQVISRLAQGLTSTVRQLATMLMDAGRINIADKLATILGDAKKLLDDIARHNIETLKSLMARLNWAERLAQVNQLMQNALRTLAAEAAQWVQEAGEQLQRLFEAVKHRLFKREKPKERFRRR